MSWYLSTAYGLLERIGYRPRELYTFARGNQVFRMTGGTSLLDAIASRVGIAYTPALITRDKIERSDESRANAVTVRVARTTPIADALREVHSEPMTLRIERWQDKVADNPVPVVVAEGDVANVRLLGGWVEFDLLTGESIFDLPFPSRLISRQNQYETFSPFTGVEEDDFSFETTIDAIAGSTITVADKAPGTSDGYYDGGMIRVGGIGDHGEAMYVRASTGFDFTINGRLIAGLNVGDPVTLVAGDDKSLVTARDKFGQIAVENFLGFDLLPTSDLLQTGLQNAPIIRSPYSTPVGIAPGTPTAGVPDGLTVSQSAVETAGGASVFLTVDDPGSILVRLEARSNATGFDPDWTSFVTLTPLTAGGSRYRYDASKGPAGLLAVEIKVTYIDPDDLSEHSVTSPLLYQGGLTTEQILDEGDGVLTPSNFVFFSNPLGTMEERVFITMTHDDYLVVPPGGGGSFEPSFRAVFSIDARGGPFTLTMATYQPDAPSTPGSMVDRMFLDGTAFNGAFTLSDAVHFFELIIDFGSGFQWRTLT